MQAMGHKQAQLEAFDLQLGTSNLQYAIQT
jgi:hypothetical protein